MTRTTKKATSRTPKMVAIPVIKRENPIGGIIKLSDPNSLLQIYSNGNQTAAARIALNPVIRASRLMMAAYRGKIIRSRRNLNNPPVNEIDWSEVKIRTKDKKATIKPIIIDSRRLLRITYRNIGTRARKMINCNSGQVRLRPNRKAELQADKNKPGEEYLRLLDIMSPLTEAINPASIENYVAVQISKAKSGIFLEFPERIETKNYVPARINNPAGLLMSLTKVSNR